MKLLRRTSRRIAEICNRFYSSRLHESARPIGALPQTYSARTQYGWPCSSGYPCTVCATDRTMGRGARGDPRPRSNRGCPVDGGRLTRGVLGSPPRGGAVAEYTDQRYRAVPGLALAFSCRQGIVAFGVPAAGYTSGLSCYVFRLGLGVGREGLGYTRIDVIQVADLAANGSTILTPAFSKSARLRVATVRP
jgi:hypothetical protein